MFSRLFCMVVAFFLIIVPSTAFAESKVALVIGNAAYQSVPALSNPRNDAEDVATTLRLLGFDVTVAVNLDKAAMDETTIKFSRAARTADVALFYYSGHALQYGGTNYLAPTDARLSDSADLRRLVRVDEIASDLQQAKVGILVLDACRDNPLLDQLQRSQTASRALASQRGLARIDAAAGMIIAYATQLGQVALDGDGRNSPYTAAFLQHIADPDEIGTVFRRISAKVYETTERKQLPELTLSLRGELYLRGQSDQVSMPRPDPCIDANAHWNSSEAINTEAAYRDHLARFPTCAFARLAIARIEEFATRKSASAPSVSPVSVPSASPDDVAWDLLKDTGDRSSLQEFIRRYPTSPHRKAAETRLASLPLPAAKLNGRIKQGRTERPPRPAPQAKTRTVTGAAAPDGSHITCGPHGCQTVPAGCRAIRGGGGGGLGGRIVC